VEDALNVQTANRAATLRCRRQRSGRARDPRGTLAAHHLMRAREQNRVARAGTAHDASAIPLFAKFVESQLTTQFTISNGCQETFVKVSHCDEELRRARPRST